MPLDLDKVIENIEGESPELKPSEPKYQHERDPRVQSPVDIDDDEFKKWLATEVGFVTATIQLDAKDIGSEEFEWYDAQMAILMSMGDTATIKCRQSGLSTVYSARAYARANLINQDWAVIFTSITKDEAKNKIGYVSEFLENSPMRFRRKVAYQTKQSIEFLNSNKSTAKIISHAQRPARGLHGDLLFDEADFYQNFPLLYSAGLPGTRKVQGRVDINTTPWNPLGFVRKILDPSGYYGTDDYEDEFNNFTRFKICWWDVPFYCKDVEIARETCPYLSTKERVYKFGTELLIKAYESCETEEEFQREYEATYLDKITQFFGSADILASVVRDIDEIFQDDFSLHWNQEIDYKQIEQDQKNSMFPLELLLIENGIVPKVFGNPQDEFSIDELAHAVQVGQVSPNLFFGMDVGTTGDNSDITICEGVYIKQDMYLIPRWWLQKSKWTLPAQQEFVEKKIFEQIPIVKGGMDTHGLGMMMGQYFRNKYPSQFICLPMLQKNLDRIMVSLRTRMESRKIGLVNYRENLTAFGSIKKDGNSWKIPRKQNGHCDSVISNGIISAIVDDALGLIHGSVSGSIAVPKQQFESSDLYTGKEFRNRQRNLHNTKMSNVLSRISGKGLISQRLRRELEIK